MFRTQIYLSEEERNGLKGLAEARGKTQSELIREAVDALLHRFGRERREDVLKQTAGMWKNRQDLPDLAKMRAGWDRG